MGYVATVVVFIAVDVCGVSVVTTAISVFNIISVSVPFLCVSLILVVPNVVISAPFSLEHAAVITVHKAITPSINIMFLLLINKITCLKFCIIDYNIFGQNYQCKIFSNDHRPYILIFY